MRIVVVDPSRTVLKAVSRLLESDGHAVNAFVDGREALDFIKSATDVSAVITSAELTSMSGLELCWETRLLSGHDRAIYVILMSSNSDQTHLVNALDSGADEFIRKPPAGEELYARLRTADRLLRQQRELIRLAMVDPLTGVCNRRAFFEKAEAALPPATPPGRSAAIMFDVDHFKRVNDVYGHDVGDEVLRAVGREADDGHALIGRLGGEEFAVLLNGSGLEAAAEHAERLRRKLAALSFETTRGRMSVTCSFGVAEWEAGETVDQLLKRADAALYEAKNRGRNRVAAATPAEPGGGEAQWSGLVRSDPRGAAARSAPDPSALHIDPPFSSSSEAHHDIAPSTHSGVVRPFTGRAFVLDDEPQIAALVCKVLQDCGLQSRQFTTPAQFLVELTASPPEFVVLDLSLGQSDAVEVIRHLEVTRYRGKVLLISGRDEITLNEIAQIGEKHGLAMLPPLQKPFRAADVKQRLSGTATDAAPAKAADSGTDGGAPKKIYVPVLEALRNHWLEVWYQPKIDLKTFSVCGAEALTRARHPEHGIIMPDHLLPPSGDPDYQTLTRFVIEHAMADWRWFAQRNVLLRLSINAPVSVIHTPAFVALIRSLVPRDSKFPGLTIEVTEDELIGDSERAHEIASQLKLYNVDLSIDDFGSGYASLSRLNDLPFVEVKIDRSFVWGCAANQLKRSLCQTVVDLAHRFGATACAEGVEAIEDLRALIAMQCDAGQGFLFAKPMPAAEFASALHSGFANATRDLLRAPPSVDQRPAQEA